jgi:hypothetical protein
MRGCASFSRALGVSQILVLCIDGLPLLQRLASFEQVNGAVYGAHGGVQVRHTLA